MKIEKKVWPKYFQAIINNFFRIGPMLVFID